MKISYLYAIFLVLYIFLFFSSFYQYRILLLFKYQITNYTFSVFFFSFIIIEWKFIISNSMFIFIRMKTFLILNCFFKWLWYDDVIIVVMSFILIRKLFFIFRNVFFFRSFIMNLFCKKYKEMIFLKKLAKSMLINKNITNENNVDIIKIKDKR